MLRKECDAADGQLYLVERWHQMHDDLEMDPENRDPDDFERIEPIEIDSATAASDLLSLRSSLQIAQQWDQVRRGATGLF
jgi:hypothetical protein